MFPDLLIRLRCDVDRLDPDYLCLVLQSRSVHRSLRAQAKGLAGSMPKIDQAAIGSVRVPLTSLERQRDIVARAAEGRDQVKHLETSIELASRRLQSLRRSLLQAAFSGRLTGRSSDLDLAEELAAQ